MNPAPFDLAPSRSLPPIAAAAAPAAAAPATTAEQRRVILASSLGTMFEWYDFYLYGALAGVIAQKFFAGLDEGSRFLATLLAFASGFLVRPVGALVFGRLGDKVGRKYTFLVTMLLMGAATFAVGLLPTHATIGAAAPALLIALRLVQGLAIGGEYGGAAVYVAEHAPAARRGEHTGWIQTTATLGLLLSLVVILGTRELLGEAAFADWGWRLPFLLSIVLLGVSVWMRMSTNESPAFNRLKAADRVARAPLIEAFGRWSNLRIVLIALFGLVAGQAAVWYTGQFYALLFLQNVLKVEASTASTLVAVALLLGTPLFVVFGALSDRIGRKPIVLAGLLAAALATIPLFGALAEAANPRLVAAQRQAHVTVAADPARCSFQFSPVASDADFASGCDLARRVLAQSGVEFTAVDAPAGSPARVRIGRGEPIDVPDARVEPGTRHVDATAAPALAAFKAQLAGGLREAGYPSQAEPIRAFSPAWWRIVAILSALVALVAMVYGPLAAMLAEMFPTRVRYTSLSLPYHVGNGWFGGLMPSIAFAMVAQHGGMLDGLRYTVGLAAATFVIGLILVKETLGRDLDADPRAAMGG